MKSPNAIRTARWRARHKEESLRRGRAAYHAKRDELVAKKRVYNARHRDEINTKSRERDRVNREAKLARQKAYREQNREQLRAKDRVYQRANTDKTRARAMKRLVIKRRAMPTWADQQAISAIYREAVRLTQTTGIEHHVDHICPLNNPLVCGLHVPYNLRIITAAENLHKSNKLIQVA